MFITARPGPDTVDTRGSGTPPNYEAGRAPPHKRPWPIAVEAGGLRGRVVLDFT